MARGLRHLVVKGCLTMEEGKASLKEMAQDGHIDETELDMTLNLLGSE
jgi:polyhydroxyalkanoate synthesis regulator phasin